MQIDGLKKRTRKNICILAKTGNNFNKEKNTVFGFDMHQGTSGFTWSFKKNRETKNPKYLLMDKAYEGDETRFLAQSLNFNPIVPSKYNRKVPWAFDKILYKSRNKIERLFRKIKRFRRIFTHYDKLYSVFLFYIYFAFIFVISYFVLTAPIT